MPQRPPPISYANLVALFTTQLTVSIHTILAARAIYPAASFIRAKAYNYPIMQSRHPGVCDWINDAVKATHVELLKGTVSRVVLVIFESYRDEYDDEDEDGDVDMDAGAGVSKTDKETSFGAEIDNMEFDSHGSPISAPRKPPKPRRNVRRSADVTQQGTRPLERYIWDVSRWPAMPKSDLHTPFSHAPSPATASKIKESTGKSDGEADEAAREDTRAQFREAMKLAHVDLHEQFRGLLARLSTIGSRITPLTDPEACTFTLCLELKEESDPPIGHPQPWIPAEAPLQRTILHPREGEEEVGVREKEGGRPMRKGSELGGVRTTPVRTVDSGEMVFEMWIEEGSAKFEQAAAEANEKKT